jgi:hypothetical protein
MGMMDGWIECVAVDYGEIESGDDRAVVSSMRATSVSVKEMRQFAAGPSGLTGEETKPRRWLIRYDAAAQKVSPMGRFRRF